MLTQQAISTTINVILLAGILVAGWARIESGSILGPWLLHGGNFGVTSYVLLYT